MPEDPKCGNCERCLITTGKTLAMCVKQAIYPWEAGPYYGDVDPANTDVCEYYIRRHGGGGGGDD